MIFVANALPMNGGSTFLLRAARELLRRGQKATIIILVCDWDESILETLRQIAKVIILKDFLRDRGVIFRKQFGIFGMVEWPKLVAELGATETHIHVMGGFGLMFARRLLPHMPNAVISAGVYHQNEFLFKRLPFFLPREIQAGFRALAAENVIFFNTSSRNNYAHFFDKDYANASVLPIGVEISSGPTEREPAKKPPKIVSIGNLVPFKTYNHHVISLLAELKSSHPDLTYEVFGDGSELEALRGHALKLGVADRVHFRGAIPYKEFSSYVRDAELFVGSGTAVIEAANLGVPALIGIESSQISETYGFLSEIEGFSYNEANINIPKRPYMHCVVEILNSENRRAEIGEQCRSKALEFSIERTMDGFLALSETSNPDITHLASFSTIHIIFSLAITGALEKISGRQFFSGRRSQSY